MFANKNFQILAGFGVAFLIATVAAIGYHSAPAGSSFETFFFAIGGKLPEGIIQACTFTCFFICVFEAVAIGKRMQQEESAYMAKLLPESEQYVLYPEDVNRIKLEAIEAEKRMGPKMLTDLIKQAATKFRSENSTGETLSLVESISEMQRKTLEKEFWLISTCQTLIPAFGLLGTVWGMAKAIMSLGDVKPVVASSLPTATAALTPAVSSNDIQSLIGSMGTAFFATILAIGLGIVVSIFIKRLETRVDDFQTNMKRYVVENLVNRIHK